MDNAAIHFAKDIRDILTGLAAVFRVNLAFLPTYSPELNPDELVFQWVKAKLRHDKSNAPLWQRAQLYFSQVTRELMVQWYKHILSFPHQ